MQENRTNGFFLRPMKLMQRGSWKDTMTIAQEKFVVRRALVGWIVPNLLLELAKTLWYTIEQFWRGGRAA